MTPRNILPAIELALEDTPVLFLNGPRQSGKSTLAHELTRSHFAHYFTFDNLSVLNAARNDPEAFLASFPQPIVIDEVQRVPDLFIAIKAVVDRRRLPGRFLLTGSANVWLLPRLSESLAGRMEVFTLYPLSQGEIDGVHEDFLERIFARRFALDAPTRREGHLLDRVLRGGFPEVLYRRKPSRTASWFEDYVNLQLLRDVRELADIQGLTDLPQLLARLAGRVSGLLNFAELSRSTTVPQTTLKRYLTLLQVTFLVDLVPAWTASITRRLSKTPKLYLIDTGLAASLLAITRDSIRVNPTLAGPLVENFAVMELRKQISWHPSRISLFHFRAHTGQEVDIVLENAAGEIVGIEVKAGATVGAHDLKGLETLREVTGKRFRRGVILYNGERAVPFGRELYAMPFETLWQGERARAAAGRR